MELLVYVRWSLGRARTPITLTQLPWNRRTSLEKTFPAEVSWKLVRDEGRERVLTIRGLLRFHWNDRLGSARRFSDTFVRKAHGKRWASSYEYGGRNKRSKKHRLAFGSPGFSSFVVSIRWPLHGRCKKRVVARCHEHLVAQERADTGRFEGGKIPRRSMNSGASWLARKRSANRVVIESKNREHARGRTCRLTMDWRQPRKIRS